MDDPIQPKVNQSDDVTIAVEAPRAGASAAALSPSPHVEARIAHETRGSKDGDIIIYPGIGVARLGDSEEWYVGPTKPHTPVFPYESGDGIFRDHQGKIKKQAAKFQLFEKVGGNWQRLDLKQTQSIEWSVHLANKKSAFYEFASVLEFDPVLDPPKGKHHTLRNQNIQSDLPPSQRTYLINDAGEKVVVWNAKQEHSVETRCKGGCIFHQPGPDLGSLFATEKGHLIVTGGNGISKSVEGKPVMDYVNNDTWYDDTSDGPVKAVVVRSDGSRVVARSSWVLVAPPKYAPTVKCPTTLWEIMEEVAINDFHYPRVPYDYEEHVHPILTSVSDVAWVNDYANKGHGLLSQCNFNDPDFLEHLNGPDGQELRNLVFSRVRQPQLRRAPEEYDDVAYGQGNFYYMPVLSGDGGDIGSSTVVPSTFLSVSPLQYDRLRQWTIYGWNRKEKKKRKEKEGKRSVVEKMYGLNQAALEWSVGGAFDPGIEVSYISRDKATYSSPFRINEKWEAGDLTAMMAVPWQADFFECQYFWWPSQRPDNVLTEQDFNEIADLNPTQQKERLATTRKLWTRNFQENPEDISVPRWGDMDMVDHWNNLGFIVPKEITLEGKPVPVLYEVERRANWLPIVRIQTEPLPSLLQQALKLEMSTIPVYLTAMWSIRTDKFPLSGLSRAQKNAMNAYNAIHRVVVEEMLHATLVGNVISALGTKPQFCEDIFFPTHIPHLEDPLIIGLGPLSPEAIKAFLRIEQPEERQETDDNEADFSTIGELYHTIEKKIKSELRDSDFKQASCQFPAEGYYPPGGLTSTSRERGKVIRIVDKKTTLEALDTIVFQGEGCANSASEHSHYKQFSRVQAEFPEFSHLVGAGVTIQSHPPSSPPPEKTKELIRFFNAGYYFLLQTLNSIYLTEEKEDQLRIIRGRFFLCMKNLLPMLAYLIMDDGFVPSFQIAEFRNTRLRDPPSNVLRASFAKVKPYLDEYTAGVLEGYVAALTPGEGKTEKKTTYTFSYSEPPKEEKEGKEAKGKEKEEPKREEASGLASPKKAKERKRKSSSARHRK